MRADTAVELKRTQVDADLKVDEMCALSQPEKLISGERSINLSIDHEKLAGNKKQGLLELDLSGLNHDSHKRVDTQYLSGIHSQKNNQDFKKHSVHSKPPMGKPTNEIV